MGGYDSYNGWYSPRKPIRADGLKPKSPRGEMGKTWWGREFINVLESFGIGARLSRGKSYARSGQVLKVEFKPGTVSASVQGTKRSPYKVSITMHQLTAKDWKNAEVKMAENVLFLAKLFSGEMPSDIGRVFEECNISLLPERPSDLVTNCSCPDWSNPCKHVAAVLYLVAEMMDEDPFLIFTWRGRSKEDLLTSLGSAQGVIKFSPKTENEAVTWRSRISEEGSRKVKVNAFWVPIPIADEPIHLEKPPSASTNVGTVLDSASNLELDTGNVDVIKLLKPGYDAFSNLLALLEESEPMG